MDNKETFIQKERIKQANKYNQHNNIRKYFTLRNLLMYISLTFGTIMMIIYITMYYFYTQYNNMYSNLMYAFNSMGMSNERKNYYLNFYDNGTYKLGWIHLYHIMGKYFLIGGIILLGITVILKFGLPNFTLKSIFSRKKDKSFEKKK